MAGTEGLQIEPLLEALYSIHGNTLSPVELGAIFNAISEQGYAIVKIGDVLPWMEAEHICPCGSTIRFGDPFVGHACFGCDCYPEPTGLYRPVAAQQ